MPINTYIYYGVILCRFFCQFFYMCNLVINIFIVKKNYLHPKYLAVYSYTRNVTAFTGKLLKTIIRVPR